MNYLYYLNKENWSYEYVFLELNLLKFIGFDLKY